MKKHIIEFHIGDRVRFIKRRPKNILGERHEYGQVVPYRGEHNPKNPRIRWNTGWGFHVPAEELKALSPTEQNRYPAVQICDIDQ